MPGTPADGIIETFDVADALGTIRLATGDAVRFGRSTCSFEPAVGLAVRVLAAEVGPLARVRATRVERRASADEHERLLDERDCAAGFPERRDSFDEEGLGSAKLGVTTLRPIPDRSALRMLWDQASLGSIARLDFVPGPVAIVGQHQFQVLFGAGPLDSVLDSRFCPPGVPLGDGFVGFWDGVPQLARDPSLSASNGWGFGPKGSARAILDLVARLARCRAEVTGVVIGRAGALWLRPEEWLRRTGDIRNPSNIPIEAFLDVAYGPEEGGVRRLRSFGMMMALALPDIEVDDALAAQDDARHELCESVVWAACRVLAGEDALRNAPPEVSLPVGRSVKVRVEVGVVSFCVVGYTDEEKHTLRVADLTIIG